ncbi:hypothetical protein [Nonomuraea sp. NPDC050643]|uniref:hypothetical protein n=1 Tax=Nonomuraea sp. NPDC050643 TaxID=3155660 RepID=UPI0033E7E1E8
MDRLDRGPITDERFLARADAESAEDGGATGVITVCRPAQGRHRLRSLMHLLGAEQGLMLVPEGTPPPESLRELGWRKARQMVDEVSGLPLDVLRGPIPGDHRRTR